MNENLETLSLDVQNDFKKILENEPEMAKAISLVVKHVAGTYTDKYAKGIDEIDTKKMLYGKDWEMGEMRETLEKNKIGSKMSCFLFLFGCS